MLSEIVTLFVNDSFLLCCGWHFGNATIALAYMSANLSSTMLPLHRLLLPLWMATTTAAAPLLHTTLKSMAMADSPSWRLLQPRKLEWNLIATITTLFPVLKFRYNFAHSLLGGWYSIGAVGLGVAVYAPRGFRDSYATTVPMMVPSATMYAVAHWDDYHLPSVDSFDVGGWYSIGAVGSGVALYAPRGFQAMTVVTPRLPLWMEFFRTFVVRINARTVAVPGEDL